MLYAQFDCSFPNDPKVVEAGDLAELLYVRAVLHCRANLTDGVIDRRLLARVAVGIRGKPEEHARRLVAAGLWTEHADGWAIPLQAWCRWNPTKSDVDHKRQEEAARKKAYRDRRNAADVRAMSQRDTDGTPADVQVASGARDGQPKPEPELNQKTPPTAAEPDPKIHPPSFTAALSSSPSTTKVKGTTKVNGVALRAASSTPPVPPGPPWTEHPVARALAELFGEPVTRPEWARRHGAWKGLVAADVGPDLVRRLHHHAVEVKRWPDLSAQGLVGRVGELMADMEKHAPVQHQPEAEPTPEDDEAAHQAWRAARDRIEAQNTNRKATR